MTESVWASSCGKVNIPYHCLDFLLQLRHSHGVARLLLWSLVVVMRRQMKVMAAHNVEAPSHANTSQLQSKRVKWNVIKTMIIYVFIIFVLHKLHAFVFGHLYVSRQIILCIFINL